MHHGNKGPSDDFFGTWGQAGLGVQRVRGKVAAWSGVTEIKGNRGPHDAGRVVVDNEPPATKVLVKLCSK